jgi:Holliday junction resolvasome RuvABC endonuclease subunit
MAVDPSMGSCGIAFAQTSSPLATFILGSGVLQPPQRESDATRVAFLGLHLRRAMLDWDVQRVLVETPSTMYVKQGRSLDTLKVLMVIGAVYAVAGAMGVPVHGMTVNQWKGGGSQYKEHSVALARALWPNDQRGTEDEAEARLLALAFIQPDEMRAALGLMKLHAPVERAIGVIKREWPFGPRELSRIEDGLKDNRLRGVAGSRKGQKRKNG